MDLSESALLQRQPLFFDQKDLLGSDFSEKKLLRLQSLLSTVPFRIGLEHSHFTDLSMRKKIPVINILSDINRFHSNLNATDFFNLSKKDFQGQAAAERIKIPKSLWPVKGRQWDSRAFVGRKGDRSSFHFDWLCGPNLLVNLYGEKTLFLSPPSSAKSFRGYSNFSFVSPGKQALKFELLPHQAVLIPPFWWHQALYNTNAISVSFRILPSDEENFFWRYLYPSWKVTAAFGSKRPKTDLIKSLHRRLSADLSIEDFFKITEEELNLFLNFSGKNHPFYQKWCLGYLAMRRKNPRLARTHSLGPRKSL